MNRRKFIGIAGGTVLVAAGTGYLLSDKAGFTIRWLVTNYK